MDRRLGFGFGVLETTLGDFSRQQELEAMPLVADVASAQFSSREDYCDSAPVTFLGCVNGVRLYVGSEHVFRHVGLLEQQGISWVVDCRGDNGEGGYPRVNGHSLDGSMGI